MIASLLNHLWQSTLFALLVALVVRALRDEAARIRYALWLAASIKFLVPFSLLTALGARLAPLPERSIPEIVAWQTSFERLAEPVETSVLSGPLAATLLGVWIAGAIALLTHSLLRARMLGALVRDASTPAGAVSAALPIPLPIRYAATQIEPALVGVARPLLLLPKDVEARLTPAQLDAVIAHELCHWKRKDNLTGALHMLVEALFWFHPLVWWIGSRLVHERERACDEAVVAAGHDRLAYAEAILNVAELQVASPMKCAAGVGGVDLKGRVTAVMRSRVMKKLGTQKKLLLNIGGLATVAAPVAFGWLAASSAALAQVEEYLPIVKIAPEYPAEAAALGLEGYVVVEFTVDANGSVTDLFVVESSSPLFEVAALEAASKFKYKPRLVDGVPVAVPGIRNRITFVVDTDDFVRENGASPSGAAPGAA